MSQDSIVLSTTPPFPGLLAVQNINKANQSIATDFAGTTDPAAVTGPYMTWADTANNLIKRRNAANNAWVVEGTLFLPTPGIYPSNAIPASDQGTDLFVQGVGRMRWFNGLYAPNNFPTLYRSKGETSLASTTTITTAPGQWRAFNDECDIILSAGITKSLQSSGAWAAGNGGNGLFTGSRANSTMYYKFVIRKDSDGSVDAGFDTSIIAANRPAGYTAFRRVAAAQFGVGAFSPYTQAGTEFFFDLPLAVLTNNGLAAGWSGPYNIFCPAGVRSIATLNASMASGSSSALYVGPSSSGSLGVPAYQVFSPPTGGGGASANTFDTMTDTNGQVHANVTVTVASGFNLAMVKRRDFLQD
jgi:hypothetical protein